MQGLQLFCFLNVLCASAAWGVQSSAAFAGDARESNEDGPLVNDGPHDDSKSSGANQQKAHEYKILSDADDKRGMVWGWSAGLGGMAGWGIMYGYYGMGWGMMYGYYGMGWRRWGWGRPMGGGWPRRKVWGMHRSSLLETGVTRTKFGARQLKQEFAEAAEGIQTHNAKLAAELAKSEDTTQACLNGHRTEFDDMCTGNYPRSCLTSKVPFSTSYAHVRKCYACCMNKWTVKLGLDRNFEHHNKLHVLNTELLAQNMGYAGWEHTLDEVLLTPNSLMKFAHVLFSQTLTDQAVLHIDNVAEMDPPLHRNCVDVKDRRCEIPDGGLVLFRAFYYSDEIERRMQEWANVHGNFSVLIEGDKPRGDEQLWEKAGGVAFRTNPLHPSEIDPRDRNFYPLGMSAHQPTQQLDRMLAEVRDVEGHHELLFCDGLGGARGDGPDGHREAIISQINKNGFNCRPERLSFDDYVRRMSKAKFALAPKGVGFNTYRTWEALEIGTIPLISWHPAHEKMMNGLPVVMIKDWSSVTQSYLEEQWVKIKTDASISRSKAFLPYWVGTLFAHLTERIS